MSWYIFFGSIWGTKHDINFSNLRVSTLQKSMMLSELLAFAQNWGILQTRMDQREDCIKINFDYFQIKNECYKQLEQKKYMKKLGSLV